MRTMDIGRLRELLDYDPETGLLTNKRLGRVVGGNPTHPRGYCQIKLDKRTFLTHRVVWAICKGEWPELALDHINGDPGDNRISNLRLATTKQNSANRRLNKNSSTGIKNVTRHRDKFQAAIMVDGKNVHIGVFCTPEEADEAACAAREKLYGEFANHG